MRNGNIAVLIIKGLSIERRKIAANGVNVVLSGPQVQPAPEKTHPCKNQVRKDGLPKIVPGWLYRTAGRVAGFFAPEALELLDGAFLQDH